MDDKGLSNRCGAITRIQMTATLNARGYPSKHAAIIEEVMRRYDLLYDSADEGAEKLMLIPLMLQELMPEFPWPTAGTLEFRYQYQVMPAGLLPAFMARMHRYLSPLVGRW